MVDRQAGHVFVEAIISMAVLGVLASFAFTGDRSQLQHVAQSLAETKAQRLAASRLETLKATPGPLALGRREFVLAPDHTVGLPAAVGHELMRTVEPGLVEIEVTVSWLPAGARKPRRARLTTWIDREAR